MRTYIVRNYKSDSAISADLSAMKININLLDWIAPEWAGSPIS